MKPSARRPAASAVLFVYGSTCDTFPNDHYIHPFHGTIWDYSGKEGKEHPRTVRVPTVAGISNLTRELHYPQIAEMGMHALSNAILEKPNRWEKIPDPVLVAKRR